MDSDTLKALLPTPKNDAHKYSRGTAVVVAGCASYPGAACLCAQAAQYAGAGYTRVFTDSRNVSLLQAWRPSLVVSPFDAFDAAASLNPAYPGAVVVGPGFDEAKELGALVLSAIKDVAAPLLIDGGALSFCAKKKARKALAWRADAGRVTVLTPHEGEARRLAKPIGLALDSDPFNPERAFGLRKDFARALSASYRALIVLKGADTFIAAPGSDEVSVIREGTAALAKAGTGDVLAGIIGGLLAQGVTPRDAALLGTTLHARAGCLAASKWGTISVCAEEVLEKLPQAIQAIEASSL